jgi:hypothetical protein
MSDRIDRQFDEADAAVTQAVTRFASEIQSMFGKWEAVAPSYIIQNMPEQAQKCPSWPMRPRT